MRRLDEADRQAGFGQLAEFATQPELAFCFDQFSAQMLLKNSTALNLIDLQAEMNRLEISGETMGDERQKNSVEASVAPETLNIDSFFTM